MNTASRFAATATPETDDEVIDVQDGDDQMHELFEQWSAWCRTRRFYAPPSNVGSILGQLRGPSRPSRQPPSAKCSTSMAALKASIGGEQPGQLPGAAPSAAQGELPAGTFEQPPAPGAPVAGESATSSENLR